MLNSIDRDDFEYILKDKLVDWEKFAGKSILITGASGALPSYIAKTLLYLNSLQKSVPTTVLALVRNLERAKQQYKDFLADKNLIFIEEDVINPLNYNGNIDYIVHAASLASPKYFYSNPVEVITANVIGTNNLLALAKEKNVKSFLYFSSGEVCGNIFDSKDLVSENDYGVVDPLNVRNCYSESKRQGENLCYSYFKEYDVPIKIVRPSHTYGPSFKKNDGRAFVSFVMNVVNNENIVLNSDGSAKRSFVYIADAVRAYFLVLLSGVNGEAYNVGNDREISIKELAELLIDLSDNKDLKVVFDIPKDAPSSKSTHGQLDISKIKKLGWNPKITEREGFARTIKAMGVLEL